MLVLTLARICWSVSSPYLFNLFYQKLIDSLSKCTGSIQIGEISFNVFCYADDLVLTSLSVSGLQEFINSAKSFTVSHGLNFNPSKTVCTTFGHTVFERTPSWTLDGITLREQTSVTYLGTTMSDNPTNHIKAVLSFGCATVNIKSSHISELEKTQGILIKAALNLPKRIKNTSLLRALNLKKVKYILDLNSSIYNKYCLLHTSRARAFYLHLIRKHQFCDISRSIYCA